MNNLVKIESFIFLLTILLLCTIIYADSIDVKLIPVSIEPQEISISGGFSRVVSFGKIKTIFFFDSRDSKLSDDDKSTLISFGEMLVQNRDANLVLFGYYSSEYDDILSPQAGIKLANNRAENIFRQITKNYPMVGDRISISDTHNFEQNLFPDSSSFLDMRVQCAVEFAKFSPRTFYPTDRMPYWRRSYKEIIGDLAPELNKIFVQDPEAIAVIAGYGFDNNSDSYKWLDFLRGKIIEKIDDRFARRIIIFVNPTTVEKTPYARIIMLPKQATPFGKIYGFLQEPQENEIELQYTVDTTTTPILPNTFYCDFSPSWNYCGFLFPLSLSSRTGSIRLKDIPILPNEYLLSFYFPDIGMSKIDVPVNFAIEDTFYDTWEIPAWQFFGNELSEGSYTAVWAIASTMDKLIDDGLSITLTISSNYEDENISTQKSRMLWQSIEAALSFIAGVSSRREAKISKWLTEHNVSVEISSSLRNSPENNFSQSDNSIKECKVVLQFSGATR